jgi:hypothetical protein
MRITINRQKLFWSQVNIPEELIKEIIRLKTELNVIPLLCKFILTNNQFKILKNTCWEWLGSLDKNGYGKVFSMGAHRYSWCSSRINTNIKNKIIRHTCDNPICVNPFHLRIGSAKDNSNDMILRNRSLKGESHPDAILKDVDIPIILKRLFDGDKLKNVAKHYKVTEANLYGIYQRKTWTHITKNYDQEYFNIINKNLKMNTRRNKLIEEDIIKIRNLYYKKNMKKCELSRMFNVGPTTITNILDGTFWSYV